MSNKPTPVYVSELKIQIEFIDKRLAELEDKAYQGNFSAKCKPEDVEEFRKLRDRKKELLNRLIYYDP